MGDSMTDTGDGVALEDETGSETQDGVNRRMDRRDALRKAAAGAAIAGVAWSAPSVKGLTLVPDYASAGTVTGLTRTFRILGVERNFPALDSGTDKHDFSRTEHHRCHLVRRCRLGWLHASDSTGT